MKRILVGIDGSPQANVVLKNAVELAEKTGAQVILFRAVGVPTEVPAVAYALPPSSLEELMQGEARHSLEEFARKVPPRLLLGTRVGIGTPWRAICEAAREEFADLIIIGSHSSGTLDRWLGTTAAKVVDHADRSVLVVRQPESDLE
jgi:nucleotide-binding universal stress UspA family protein